jgi:hypothetical protein
MHNSITSFDSPIHSLTIDSAARLSIHKLLRINDLYVTQMLGRVTPVPLFGIDVYWLLTTYQHPSIGV